MFGQLKTMLKLTALLLVLVLGSLVWVQNNTISNLKAKNQMQAQNIQELTITQKRLNEALVKERKAIQEQQRIENHYRAKADEDVKVIYKTIKGQDCANHRLPDDVIKRLQYDKDKYVIY